MARIIVSMITGLQNGDLPAFYEGFLDALKRGGNDILVIVTNEINQNPWKTNNSKSGLDKHKLDKFLKDFNPHLVIAFNNSTYRNIPSIVDCPVLVWAVDSLVYFPDMERLKSEMGRYSFICLTEQFAEYVGEHLAVPRSKLSIVPFATDFLSKSLEQDKPISFIGSLFGAGSLKAYLEGGLDEKARQDLALFYEACELDPLLQQEKNRESLKLLGKVTQGALLNTISNNHRVQVLQSICDLGLHLYGNREWLGLASYSMDLVLCYRDEVIYTQQQQQELYNSSKININISHAQTVTGGVPWRVFDIMATQGALLTDELSRPGMESIFGKKSRVPFYGTPVEARQICKRLLESESWRSDIVQSSNEIIQSGHRFVHRIRSIQDICGVNLLPGGEGRIERLDSKAFFKKLTADTIKSFAPARQLARFIRKRI